MQQDASKDADKKKPAPVAAGYGQYQKSSQDISTTSFNGRQHDSLLLNARDTAKALSIGQRKLWELTNCREIPCVRIGRRVLYDPADLRAFIEKQKAVRS